MRCRSRKKAGLSSIALRQTQGLRPPSEPPSRNWLRRQSRRANGDHVARAFLRQVPERAGDRLLHNYQRAATSMSKIDGTLRRIRQELAAVPAPALPAQPVHGGGRGGGLDGPLPFIYPIFQVSPDTRSLAMSPGPRSEMDFCSCWITISS